MKQLLILIAAAMLFSLPIEAQTKTKIKENKMTARGTFDVKLTPQPQDDGSAGPFGRIFLDKQYHGDITAAGKGQMMAAGTGSEGSGAYVALELVSGTLGGKKGSFMLMHTGTMQNGAYDLNVTVVPDSGTGELIGISGTLKIIIEGGKHSYEFTYGFDEKK